MITYIATNTKTGQFYIGSARDYCRFMYRKGQHHTHRKGSKGHHKFHYDLQQDPQSFKWEWHEDELTTREWEKTLIALYKDSPYLYNVGEGCYERTEKHRGWNHTPDTIKRMSETAKQTSKERAKRMSETMSKKEPCPHCGKLMNPGNLKQHLRARTCQKQG
jgi:hypothetical protein